MKQALRIVAIKETAMKVSMRTADEGSTSRLCRVSPNNILKLMSHSLYLAAIGYSREGPNRKWEEHNDFYWLG